MLLLARFMMFTRLTWALVMLTAQEPEAVYQRGVVARVAIAAVAVEAKATVDEQVILISIAHHESLFDRRAVDAERGACGPTQIEGPSTWGSSCKAIHADELEGYRVALKVLRYSVAHCPGTWANALTMYASGHCGVAMSKARELCDPVGLCDVEP